MLRNNAAAATHHQQQHCIYIYRDMFMRFFFFNLLASDEFASVSTRSTAQLERVSAS